MPHLLQSPVQLRRGFFWDISLGPRDISRNHWRISRYPPSYYSYRRGLREAREAPLGSYNTIRYSLLFISVIGRFISEAPRSPSPRSYRKPMGDTTSPPTMLPSSSSFAKRKKPSFARDDRLARDRTLDDGSLPPPSPTSPRRSHHCFFLHRGGRWAPCPPHPCCRCGHFCHC